jgi:nucleoside-diphosphate-sugar epimerase
LEEVSSAVPACNVIVHAAASLGKGIYAPDISLTNCLGTQQVLKLAGMWNVDFFVYLSSVPVVGRPVQLPITEAHPARPLTAYHASKLYGEHLTEISQREGLATAILRLTAPVGPQMPKNRILSVFIKQALSNGLLQVAGEGTRRQNYVDDRDVAFAVEQCISVRAQGIFNIGGNRSISNYELAQTCVRVLASSSTIQLSGRPDPEEGVDWQVSIAKAKTQFGYRPRFEIEDSIRTMGAEHAASAH